MEKLQFKTLQKFRDAVLAIEDAKDSLTPTVKKHKASVNPDFTKPYTEYNEDTLTISADVFVIEVLSKASIDYESLKSFSNWAERFDAVAQLKKLVAESPISVDLGGGKILPLQAMVEEWYASKSRQVSSFMESGDSVFLESIKEAEDFWWDADGSTGTVREQAVAIVEPLVS